MLWAWITGTSMGRNLVAFGALLLGVLALVAALMRSSRKAERSKIEMETLRGAIETHRRINDADISTGNPDADREWLRSRAELGKRRSGSPRRTH